MLFDSLIVLMLKIIKKSEKIILIYFQVKNTFKKHHTLNYQTQKLNEGRGQMQFILLFNLYQFQSHAHIIVEFRSKED